MTTCEPSPRPEGRRIRPAQQSELVAADGHERQADRIRMGRDRNADPRHAGPTGHAAQRASGSCSRFRTRTCRRVRHPSLNEISSPLPTGTVTESNAGCDFTRAR